MNRVWGTLILLGILGISIDMNSHAQVWQLSTGFYLSGALAIVNISLTYCKKLPIRGKRIEFILLQLLAFRIAYFPIVVFSATVVCYVELGLSKVDIASSIGLFPTMFISAATFFSLISIMLFWAVYGKTVLYALIIVMGIPATFISFADTDDLTFFPDTNFLNIDPFPQIAMPQSNPYELELTSASQSLGQKMTILSGQLLYDFIPNAPWSQAVQGTLEKAYRSHPESNAHDQLREHYTAFLAAHNALFHTTVDELNQQ